MSQYKTNANSIKALTLVGALLVSFTSYVYAQTSTLSEQGQRVMAKPLTAAQRQAEIDKGKSAGDQALSDAESSTVQGNEGGGAKNAGCTMIKGKCVDNEEIMGRGYDQSKVDRAGTVDGKMSSLKTYHDEEAPKIKSDEGAVGDAYRTSEESADRKVVGRREVVSTDWTMTNQSIRDGVNGTAGGMSHPQCDTTTTVIPGTAQNAYIKEQHVCEIVNSPGTEGETLCTRERVPTGYQDEEPQFVEEYLGTPGGVNENFCQKSTSLEPYAVVTDYVKTGELDITTETGGLSCTRNRWVDMVANGYAKEKTATLGVNTETGGLSCSRQIIPSNSSTTTAQTISASLPVDNQSGGNLCKRLVWPVNTSTPTNESKTVSLSVNTEAGGLSCTRSVWPTASTTQVGANQDATLLIDTQTSGNLCTRQAWPTNTTTQVAGGKSATIGVSSELGGLSCSRTVWPTASSATTAVSHDATLAIDTQTNAWLCTRQVSPTASSTSSAGTHQATLSLDNQTPGLACTRTRVPSQSSTTINSVTTTTYTYANGFSNSTVLVNYDLSAYIAPGTTNLANFTANIISHSAYTEWQGITQYPSAANGWRVTIAVGELQCDEMVTSDCAKFGGRLRYTFSWGNQAASTSWSLSETGNCSDAGSANCPTQWSCTQSAPTTLSGIAVSTGDVSGLTALYPGASNICVAGRLDRVCGGTGSRNNSISIAARLAPGTTSITGFGFNVTNPQSGVGVVLTDAPTAANGWVATFRVDRTNWNYVAAPNIAMFWNNVVPSTNVTVQDIGNCASSGTANCPATWRCDANAPIVINGITVDSAMAASVAPLFPGASSSCARSALDRVCSGAAVVQSSVNLASRMPSGTTSISSFGFSVLNPQSGVTVTLAQTPTAGNGWVAIFNVTRTAYSYQPAPPNIRATWNATTPATNVTVQDSGNCSDPGSTQCPTSWACAVGAPHIVNGISVTGAMAASQAPLYPGAPSICVVGHLTRNCSGSSNTSTSISIADQLQPGTSSISNFAFIVTNPQAGVTVSLVQVPAAANAWVAVYSVTRSNIPSATNPNINMTWNATVPAVSMSVQDTGNCAATGSTNCPAQWSCTSNAPTTINGIVVDAAKAAQVAPLFTGAASTCTRASRDKVCSGTASINTTVSLAARMPAGTSSISGLTFSVLNPQSGVTVSMTGTPTSGNGWVATFKVDRTVWGSVPVAPNIRISWNSTVPSTNVSVQDSGNCNDPGSTTCPTSWACTNAAPHTVNGISVTASMAASQAPLFPGASSSCVVGRLSRVCSGSSSVGNTVSIADKIPAGVTAISNFGFNVNNPQAGITVALVSAPTSANGWVATFNVTRAGVPNPPAAPQITVSWTMNVPGVNVTVQDTGDCAASGSAQCPAVWRCDTQAPTTANGINVTTAMAAQVAPLYTGAASTCAVGSLDKQCSGSANTQTSISIASRLPAGTTAISNFSFVVTNPQSGVSVTNTQVPSSGNSWVAIFRVTRTDFSVAKANPNITISWDATVPTVTLTVTDTGNCTDPGSVSCPTQWGCVSSAPVAVNGITITAAMAATKAPLFQGASSTCVRGDLSRVCQGSAVVGTTVGVGELIPSGATGISDFAFTVLNPQTGVTVALASAPTLANGWTATFNVTRTNWSQTPVGPQVKVTFTVNQMDPVFSVKETGNCADTGSQACPTSWSCTQNAPTTINSVNVTAAMVTPLPVLFTGAANTCVVGELRRVCGGSSSAQTTISIGDQIAAGTTEITAFAWNYTNPDPALTVTLVSAPTAANGWGATFSVIRNYAGGTTPAKPSITLSWKVTTTAYRARVITTGDCSPRTASAAPPSGSTMLAAVARKVTRLTIEDALAAIKICTDPEDAGCGGGGGGGSYPPGGNPPPEPPPTTPPGDACEIKWECTKSMPADVGGIPVSQAMLDERGPLFDGDGPPAQCLEATYKRECANAGAGGVTEISIAHKLRPGTETMSNYTWSLVEPGAGVTVASTQDPVKANNWVAKFTVTRSDFSVAPVSPKVRLEWNQPGEVTYEFPIKETGDCSAGEEDEFCKITWTCDDKAPQPSRPLKVCNHVQTPWYSGASATFNNPGEKNFNLQSFVANGTRAIESFRYVVSTNVTGCQVNATPFPPAAANMRVNQTTSAAGAGVSCAPQIRFEWDNLCDDDTWEAPEPPPGGWGDPRPDPFPPPYNQQQASLNPTQKFIAATRLIGNELVRPAIARIMICEGVDCDYGSGGGGGWDGGDVTEEPPLFPGDGPPASCMKATKKMDCSGTWTGTECWIDADGNEHCETVDPETQPNNECPQYDADPDCQLVRSECTDGAMASNGTCYVQSRLYECKKKIPGGVSDPVIEERTTCAAGSPGMTLAPDCMDGSCTKTEEVESASMSKAGAKMMLLQTFMNDTSTPPGVVAANDVGGTSQLAAAQPKRSFTESVMDMVGVATANAQTMPDPFQPPPGEEGNDEGDAAGLGGMAAGSLSGMSIRFFPGEKRDCMKALGGLFNCCKKRPPQDQAPTLWEYMKKNLIQANNKLGLTQEEGDGNGAFEKLLAGAGHQNLQEAFTSGLQSLKGGGKGSSSSTDASMGKAYDMFMEHETKEVKPKLAWYCDNDEFELAVGLQTGTCTHLGSFCQTKVLGMCVIKKDRYCCFNSPVTRIIREDMSNKGIASLGTAKNPSCGGLTIEQVSRMNLDEINTDEVEGRMAQGNFNIDIGALQSMNFGDLSSMLDGANSMLGDSTRVNPEDRNQGYVDVTDPAGSYGSIMGDQQSYRPTTPTPVETTEGTVGLNAVERDVARGFPFTLNVVRRGTKGAVSVRVWTENGTAIAGTHYEAVNTTVYFANGEEGSKKVLLKPLDLTQAQLPVPRQSLKVKIAVTGGDAKLDGNPETLIWLSAEK